MATDLQTILRMRKPKGRHVGAAMLFNLVYDFELAGQAHEPLFSQEKLSRMAGAFSSDYELRVYSNYADIVSGAEHLFDYMDGCVQQAMHGFYRLNAILSELSLEYKLRAAAQALSIADTDKHALLAPLGRAAALLNDKEERAFVSVSYQGLILPAVRDMLAFDCFWSILAEATGVEELVRIQSRAPYVLETISLLNRVTQDLPDPALSALFPPVDVAALSPDEASCLALRQCLKNINHERCLALKKLKPLVLSLGGGGETA